MEARVFKSAFENTLGPVFLDSDDLMNLQALKDHVRRSCVVVLLLSESVMRRSFSLLLSLVLYLILLMVCVLSSKTDI